ncbi:SDR family oxidoreductase [Citreimonas salinaria]|uniref:NADP-dependent 3-hydroxy acid dehydrogenase YdfG n=1 Tax=Citreimonas salinaria TaxID=321339 RepID=A0A1H3JKZ8_9RHOB|nr:SDR family NAD(P)-dependent oxidoreductase [Citreimonas salinaria]SDY40602.1 NADP-dependent 3-hydroxy acid dehydrogenase YdfG [Citreimonas salinaria]
MTRTIFITGASSGIGAATAHAAVEAGWNVGLFARSEAKLADLAETLGDAALPLPGDATEFTQQQKAVDRLAEHFGSVDAAFANAGTGLSAAGTEAGDPEEWEHMIRVNVMGLLWTAKAAMPHLRKAKGDLLLTGSAAGRRHIKGSVYGASKWFVHGYGGNLAEEMREFGGRCTVIAPGMVDTPFFDEPKPDKLQAEDIARAAMFALDADKRAAVQEIFVMPND